MALSVHPDRRRPPHPGASPSAAVSHLQPLDGLRIGLCHGLHGLSGRVGSGNYRVCRRCFEHRVRRTRPLHPPADGNGPRCGGGG
eukprot:7371763-Lingulodinium_polyedra.AAC.1